MVIVKDLDLWYDHEDYIEASEEDDTDYDIVLIDEQEVEVEVSDDDQEEEDEDGEEIKINFLQVEDMNMWYTKNYKLAVEVVEATGIDSGTSPDSFRQYYVIVFNRVGIVRKTGLSIGHNSSVRWNSNEPFMFPVDGLNHLKGRMEKDDVVDNDDDDGNEDEEEFIYFQIVRAESFDELGTSHGHIVVGQARVNVPLFLLGFNYDLDVVEPFRLGSRRKGVLRVKMLLSKMIPPEEELKGSSVGGATMVVERRRTTKGIKIN